MVAEVLLQLPQGLVLLVTDPSEGKVQLGPDLGDRPRRVLAALVSIHARTAHPVSSESLSVHGEIGLSPASIRHDLAELEDAGLLDRAHASAGRVPTARGFEYYVRTLLQPETFTVTVSHP